MRSAVNNPFVPGSDVVPPVWAGRGEQLADWATVVRPRLQAGLYERGRVFLGEPGLGKSSLVRRIAELAQEEGDWVTPQVRLPAGSDPLKALARALLELAHDVGLAAATEARIARVLDRVRAVQVSGVAISVDGREGADPYVSLTDLLREIGVAATREGRVVLIHIDEVQNISDDNSMSQLLVALGDAISTTMTVQAPGGVEFERLLPIAVYLTGLPEFAERATTRSGATFARRFATTTLAPISDDEFELALAEFTDPGWPVGGRGEARVHMWPEARARLAELSQGEPFVFQLAGARAWYAGTGEVITLDDVERGWRTAVGEVRAHVERVLERLPAKELELLEVMAALDPPVRTASEIARVMGYPSATNIGPFAQRLDTIRGIISRGRRYSFRHRAVEAHLVKGWPDPES